jgi:hypothetical protein
MSSMLASIIGAGLANGTFDSVEQARARRDRAVRPKIDDAPETINTSRTTSASPKAQEAAYDRAAEKRARRAARLLRDPGYAR